MKKIISLLFILGILLSLVACGDSTSPQAASDLLPGRIEDVENGRDSTFPLTASDLLPDRIEDIENGGVVPEEYQKASLAKGKYPDVSLTGCWKAEDDRPDGDAGYISFDTEVYASNENKIEYFATSVNFGLDENRFPADTVTMPPVTYAGLYAAEYFYITDAGSEMFTTVLYKVSGDTLAFGFYEKDGTDALVKVQEVDYQIKWTGWDLTLTYNGVSCTYIPLDIISDGEVTGGGNIVDGYEPWNNMVGIFPWWPKIQYEHHKYIDAAFQFNEDGTAKISAEGNDYSIHFRYSGETLTIIDGETESVYAQFADWDRQTLQDSVDSETLNELSDNEVEVIAEQHDTVLENLKKAFNSTGVDVTIDENTGTITMDSSILFAVDDATISDEGKALLDAFIDVYVPTILSDECVDYIAKIIIEGHTDTSGSYEYNQELSEKRAEAVAEYYKTESTNALSGEDRQAFTELLEVKGCSYDNPIYSENGEVDMDASRRVTFRFMMKLEP